MCPIAGISLLLANFDAFDCCLGAIDSILGLQAVKPVSRDFCMVARRVLCSAVWQARKLSLNKLLKYDRVGALGIRLESSPEDARRDSHGRTFLNDAQSAAAARMLPDRKHLHSSKAERGLSRPGGGDSPCAAASRPQSGRTLIVSNWQSDANERSGGIVYP